jgi:Pterin-4a-carbinolamine dehydratase
MTELLSTEAIHAALAAHPAWAYEEGALRRSLRFADFSTALAFLVRVGIEAEKANHHPELTNVYARVDVALTTHDAGGVTDKDVALAQRIDEIAATMTAK